jgi:hypothetical protein
MATLSQSQIETLWTSNGGDPAAAQTFAGIANAESGGNTEALNNDPSTGDYSIGLWQINYRGTGSGQYSSNPADWPLYNSRVKEFGSPSDLQSNPNRQAGAAISLSNNGQNLSPWAGDSYVKSLGSGGVAAVSSAVAASSAATTATTYSPVIPTGPGAESGGVFPGTVFGPAITIAPNALLPIPSGTNGIISSSAINGFGNLHLGDVIINGSTLTLDVTSAISDIIVERNIAAASTVTLQMTDPQRQILRNNIFNYFDALELDGLLFALVEQTKTGDQLQVIFEAAGVALLRLQSGITATTTTSDITSFAESLVSAIPGLGFVGEPTPLAAPIAVGRGTTSNPQEDSWTCLVRIAATAGWRCFESANVVYFGGDDFWASFPSQGVLTEPIAPEQPQSAIYNIDFDYDIGQPFGNITVTGISNLWQYPPGAVVTVAGCGPANGNWLVSDIQRDLFAPQMTCTLQTAIVPALYLNPSQNSTGIVTGG